MWYGDIDVVDGVENCEGRNLLHGEICVGWNWTHFSDRT